MNIVVTGSNGFIAKNLLIHLDCMENIKATGLNRSSDQAEWIRQLDQADIVFHLAGTNRPPDAEAFQTDNIELTRFIVDRLEKSGRYYKLIFSSSTQAILNNPYGKSKMDAEDYIRQNTKAGKAVIYRLPGAFGKWSRPNYNSVVATFCYNTANHLPLQVGDPDFELRLVYIDDIVRSLIAQIQRSLGSPVVIEEEVEPEYSITLGKLAATIMSFQYNRNTLFIPNLGDGLEKALYSTWLTYLPVTDFAYDLELKTDARGSLFELLKTKTAGQIFLSTTLPGITRGNHFHHSKTEKFVVIRGSGRIQFRSLMNEEVINYDVDGNCPRVVDVPPGYTHNITNTGSDTMITLFWANELFDPQNPDTFPEKV